jgi:hypothetical protein
MFHVMGYSILLICKNKPKQTTLSHKTHTSLSRRFFEDGPKRGRKNIWWVVGI